MRTISLLIISLVACYVQAQDFVIGGQAKTSNDNDKRTSVISEKYDSLRNIYNYPGGDEMMIGQYFTYYNLVDYASYKYFKDIIPYPWKDGRERSGRYTSSETAKNAYLAELKKKSGTKYKLTEIVSLGGNNGYVFTDDHGESILYKGWGPANWEFLCDGYKEKFRKMYVGKEVYYLSANQNMGIRNQFIELQSRKTKYDFPNMSKWQVKGLGVDTTYWGNRPDQDSDNDFCRLVFVIHNDELGDYEVFVEPSGLMYKGNLKKQSPKFILTNMLAQYPMPWGENISTREWKGIIPSEILSSARNGDADAIYAIIKYSNFAVFHDAKNINITLDDYIELIDRAVELGYTHPQTSKWLYEAL